MGRAQPARGDGPAPVEACCGEKPNLLMYVVFVVFSEGKGPVRPDSDPHQSRR